MKGLRSWLFLAAALGLVIAGFAWVFNLRLASGEVYPRYSSLRADALGTRVLHDALERIPGLRVERDFRPLPRLQPRDRTVFIAGTDWREWESLSVGELRAFRAAVQNGARLVIAFPAEVKSDESVPVPGAAPAESSPVKPVTPGAKAAPVPQKPVEKKVEKKDEKPSLAPKKPKKILSSQEIDQQEKSLSKEWGVTLKQRWLFSHGAAAQRAEGAPADLPEQIEWHSDVHFILEKDSPWRVLYRRASEPVLIERSMGRGSIVLMADSFCLSNEAMQRARATPLVAWCVGAHREILFHEGALGVLEDNGLGALARRYGLGGAVALTVLLGALYAWRRLVAFVPPPEEGLAPGEVALAHNPAAGLTFLLRRSLGGAGLLAACVAEWRKSRRSPTPAEARLVAAWQADQSGARPAETYNALVRALKSR